MEKDFSKETPDSDKVPDEDEKELEDPEGPDLTAFNQLMMTNAINLSLIEKLQKERESTLRKIAYYEGLSQLPTSPVGGVLTPLDSPTHESQNLSEDAIRNFLVSGNVSKRSEETVCEPDKSIEEQSKDVPSDLQNFKDSTQFESVKKSPKKSSDNEILESGSHIELNNPSFWGITEPIKESVKYHVSKGKEAANPAFRYKKKPKAVSSGDSSGKSDNQMYSDEKKSKANVSSSESLAKESPIKSFDKIFHSPVSRSHDSQSPKTGHARISPAIKRKGSYSDEKDIDESCGKSPVTSKSRENRTDEDSNIAKKLKFKDDETLKSQYPGIMNLLLQKKNKSDDLAQFMEQSSYDREQMNIPSTSSQSNIARSISNSEESSLGSPSDVISLGSEDAYERDGSPFSSRSEDVFSERDESSGKTISENTSNDES